MAKIESTKSKKKATFMRPGTDLINELMMTFIPPILFIERSGLRILNALSTFKVEMDSEPGITSAREINTTKKSRQFQPSLKYEVLCKTKPMPMIFIIASTMKIPDRMRLMPSVLSFKLDL